MVARITFERVLRDDDDDSGQSIRDWKIEAEPTHLTLRMKHGDGFIILRHTDVEILASDLRRARNAAMSLTEEPQ